MYRKLIVENEAGSRLDLIKNRGYTVTQIKGLNPPAATVNMASLSGVNGSKFNSAKIEKRNIVITVRINSPVEDNRVALYGFFPVEKKMTLYIQTNSRNVMIDGYVESFECDLFELGQRAQISILCPQPYFRDANKTVTDFHNVEALFEFPFSIEADGIEFSRFTGNPEVPVFNRGDVETGVVIQMVCTGQVENPKIYNSETKEHLSLDATFLDGDVILINTTPGEKAITLLREGEEQNIINSFSNESSWITLKSGINVFTYTCDSGSDAVSVRIDSQNMYSGV